MATQFNRAMVSETSICNQALSWLGQETLTSLDDNTTYAEVCRSNYPFIRDAVLEDANWSFAVDRQSSTSADAPEWGEGFVHQLPIDWLRVYKVFSEVSGDREEYWQQAQWRKEGDQIVTGVATVHMMGTKRITDTGKFSSQFIQCLATRLAADICMSITEDKVREQQLYGLYQAKLSDAVSSDGSQGRNQKLSSNRLLHSRIRQGVYNGGFF